MKLPHLVAAAATGADGGRGEDGQGEDKRELRGRGDRGEGE